MTDKRSNVRCLSSNSIDIRPASFASFPTVHCATPVQSALCGLSRLVAMLPLCPSPLTLIFVYVYLYGSLLISGVRSGTSPEGSSCSTANNRIDKLSHRFVDDCDDKTFCSGPVGGSCIPKRCRTDVFPFGYKDGDVLPPLCDPGSFCPDEGGGCVPLVEVGRPCQMNQDRQCAPPPNWQELASDWNSNGSVCLGSVCSCVSSFRLFLLSSRCRSPIFLSGCDEGLRTSRSANHVR